MSTHVGSLLPESPPWQPNNWENSRQPARVRERRPLTSGVRCHGQLLTTTIAAGLGRRTNATTTERGTGSPGHVSLPARLFFDLGWRRSPSRSPAEALQAATTSNGTPEGNGCCGISSCGNHRQDSRNFR